MEGSGTVMAKLKAIIHNGKEVNIEIPKDAIKEYEKLKNSLFKFKNEKT